MSSPVSRERPPIPLAVLVARLIRGEACVAGVLSGTSADGIDVALCRFPPIGAGAEPDSRAVDSQGAAGVRERGGPQVLAFATVPFAPELAERIGSAITGGMDFAASAALDRDLGLAFGSAARDLADRAGWGLDLVGSHGQTVFHHDGTHSEGRLTVQLGHGAFVAAGARASAVSDFRMADLACGGEGAPVSALVDEDLYPALERPSAILNLGGIGNLTILRARGGVLAFDTGPANALLDGLARRLLQRPFDAEGATAARGRVSSDWVAAELRHPFFALQPPKSTGRDTFGAAWIEAGMARARELGLDVPDVFASGVELVAASVRQAFERFVVPHEGRVKRVVLAGGGARNRALVRALERQLEGPVEGPVESSERHGIDPDAREALVFATLAVRAVLGQPSTDPGATGARCGGILGQITPWLAR